MNSRAPIYRDSDSPSLAWTSAPEPEVAKLASTTGKRTKELEDRALHSTLMDPILDELGAVAASLRIAPAKLPIVSHVTGKFYNAEIGGGY